MRGPDARCRPANAYGRLPGGLGRPFQRGRPSRLWQNAKHASHFRGEVAKITAIYFDASLTEVNVVARQTSKPAHHLRVLDDPRDAEVGADPARDRRRTQSQRSSKRDRELEALLRPGGGLVQRLPVSEHLRTGRLANRVWRTSDRARSTFDLGREKDVRTFPKVRPMVRR